MTPNIPETNQTRIVIIGAGFGGLALAQQLAKHDVQIVLIDKNNYHQFQPLFYQVAMAGLEPSSISFPLRKIFQRKKNVHIRITKVTQVNTEQKILTTELGELSYDYLVIAVGADTNFFGMQNIIENAMPMKSVSEAIYLRNKVLQNLEDALTATDADTREGLMNMVVVGTGPTGVEVSGTLAEMKRLILPKDYPELDFNQMKIYLFGSSAEVLEVMSDEASVKSKEYLERLGVIVRNGVRITDFDGKYAYTQSGEKIRTNNVVWAAGIKGNVIEGFAKEAYGPGNRLKVNQFNQVEGFNDIFALGDIALMSGDPKFPNGHPQVAQPAIQQGKLLAKNLFKMMRKEEPTGFEYNDLGSMATVGRHLAVVDLPFWKFQGAFAWYVWMFVHLMAILGVKNKVMVFINWLWNYITYDQSLRLIIKPKIKQ
ncbi:FAD-dependent pyridine nucleotide-disulfide oxidoreductase [Emticicia oligotrophica DSM 17448]|uniref:NADH:ubiquinone reductase (non-electrogenic) n=1 Tax=Emticicia oligotrophica (strain DSM 17448 / CIP 109782 / MTCC 6937 / GPTSA100-15) TaxID=929562 RepID=A0ABN4AQI2_EMTOG|nr:MULTISPECIES: NAD(P)/FAD-dependent oxidoreductase [Emticicia]AFK04604.1 FAD-dependent pyridine nucleotide-disulfide oxidoreductase [Emticicia oligotrophica DSM 17448]